MVQPLIWVRRQLSWGRAAACGLAIAAVAAAVWTYQSWVAPTRIALVNFPDFQAARIADANTNRMIDVERLPAERLDRAGRYDAIYLFGRALQLDDEQLDKLRAAGVKGTALYVDAPTNPNIDVTNITGRDLDAVAGYLRYGGTNNYANLLTYTRAVLDGKRVARDDAQPPEAIPLDVLFHLDEGQLFTEVDAYEAAYRAHGFFKPGGKRLALLTSVPGPFNTNRDHVDAIIRLFEARGYNVYPISSAQRRLEFMKQISPDAVIYMPHGRLTLGEADQVIAWLKDRNIPFFAPVSMFQNYDTWQQDQQGLEGALLTMSVTLPELDGAIVPYTIAAQFPDKRGFQTFRAIPDRLEKFADLVDKWQTLKAKSNADKKLAIYYYKGPGQAALTAGDMEVAASLFNTLKYLRSQGYRVDGLPATLEAFTALLQRQGPVLLPYAKGNIKEFLSTGDPALVPAADYAQWLADDLRPEMRAAVEAAFGPAPGDFMVKPDGQAIAVARLQFGNVALLPQPLPGLGDDTFKLVHGTRKAPPHSYIASYLWMRNAFKADAVMHFGTHGSLEFTPWKQVGLSDSDWSDALLGATPHFYVYTMSNVGEAIIAKRRSYTTILSHLTPPFMEAGVQNDAKHLAELLDRREVLPEGAVRTEIEISIRSLAERMGVLGDLMLATDPATAWTAADWLKLGNYMETLGTAKITAGLYTLGRAYEAPAAKTTAKLMAVDPIAYSLARYDILQGRTSADILQNARGFAERYREPAVRIVDDILGGAAVADVLTRLIPAPARARAEAWAAANRKISDGEMIRNFIGMAESADASADADRAGQLSDADRAEIRTLVAKILPRPEAKAFLATLASEKEFERAVQTLDPKTLERAKKIAAMVPAMAKAIALVEDPTVNRLLILMRKSGGRDLALGLAADPALEQAVAAERLELQKALVAEASGAERLAGLQLALSGTTLPTGLDALRQLRAALRFYDDIPSLTAAFAAVDRTELSSGAESARSSGGETARTLVNDAAFAGNLRAAQTRVDERIAAAERAEAEFAQATFTLQKAVEDVGASRERLLASTQAELDAITNALAGGFVPPSPGGDPIINPAGLPTGRNMISIDAETTPSAEAWRVGAKLADNLIAEHVKRAGRYPTKISFTLWPGDFIKTEGATLAQAMYLLGVEPVRDPFGRVVDVSLVPPERLGRPRIDIVIQTAGQFRDLAASRLALLNKAVALAAAAAESADQNYVRAGSVRAEATMKEKGLSPAEARELATQRVFGGVNGAYGTAIMGLVEAGDKWSDEAAVARQYINNMGALYDSPGRWGVFKPGVFEAMLQDTDVVVQPWDSNTWGPLKLDHVYEFMGGLDLAVRNVTGKDPMAFLNDFRTQTNPHMQGLEEAIWTEARTTLLNPAYIRALQDGGPSGAETFAETFRNTFGWNAMKPAAIEDRLWDDLSDVYVRDRLGLGMRGYFERVNPAALQEMTAVMLESARKGLWTASEDRLREIATLHAELVAAHGASCSDFVCGNAALAQFITAQLDAAAKTAYDQKISQALNGDVAPSGDAVVLRETEAAAKDKPATTDPMTTTQADRPTVLLGLDVRPLIGGLCAIAGLLGVFLWRRRRLI